MAMCPPVAVLSDMETGCGLGSSLGPQVGCGVAILKRQVTLTGYYSGQAELPTATGEGRS